MYNSQSFWFWSYMCFSWWMVRMVAQDSSFQDAAHIKIMMISLWSRSRLTKPIAIRELGQKYGIIQGSKVMLLSIESGVQFQAFYKPNFGLSRQKICARVASLLKEVSLSGYQLQFPYAPQLSSGNIFIFEYYKYRFEFVLHAYQTYYVLYYNYYVVKPLLLHSYQIRSHFYCQLVINQKIILK